MNEGLPENPGASIKQVGAVRGDVWQRFDRLQRTLSRLSPPSGIKRGRLPVRAHAEQNEWEWTSRLKHLGNRGKLDLVDVCRALNAEGARYVVVGGMAVVRLGLTRAPEGLVGGGYTNEPSG